MRVMNVTFFTMMLGLIFMGCEQKTESSTSEMMKAADGGSAGTSSADMGGAGTELEDARVQNTGGEGPGTVDLGAGNLGVEDAEVTDFDTVDVEVMDATMVDALDVGVMDATVVDMETSVDGGSIEPVSFAMVFTSVLEPKGCTAGYCHAGHAGGLLMDTMDTAYENLVNVENSTMTMCDETIRVVSHVRFRY